MRIPLLWLKDYVQTDKSPQEIADSFTRIGLMLDKPVGEDEVLDLEQRLNRSDLLSMVGCARDLSVFENIPLITPKIKSHKALSATKTSHVPIQVKTTAVNRFFTRVFLGVKVQPSPTWLKDRLEAYGIESINNIVDITNFVMTEYGQTMHAQDIDKLPAQEITIRRAKKGEKVVTLLGTEIVLDSTAFVLASGGIAQVIGGIVGGQNSGVTPNTVNILLDAGNYDSRTIRTVSRQLKIQNESVSHNDKPLDPRLIDLATSRATDLILELAGGTLYENGDYYPNPVSPQSLKLTTNRLHLISGLNTPLKQAKNILIRLGYAVTDETAGELTVEVPYWRTDLEVEDDLISDVIRMMDYDSLPSAPLITPIPLDITSPEYGFEDKLRNYLIALGAHEHITTQLVPDDGNPIRIRLENALSADQNSLRLSALETLPPVLESYRKHKASDPILFEIGKSFQKDEAEIREVVIVDPHDIRSTLATFLRTLGLSQYLLKAQGDRIEIRYQDSLLGHLQADSCVLHIPALLSHSSAYPPITSVFGHKSTLDISVSIPPNLTFDAIVMACRQASPSLSAVEVTDEYDQWKLVHFTWDEHMEDLDQLRQELIKSLKGLGVLSRSG